MKNSLLLLLGLASLAAAVPAAPRPPGNAPDAFWNQSYYTNESTATLHIRSPVAVAHLLEIIAPEGRTLRELKMEVSEKLRGFSVDLSQLGTGTYRVRVSGVERRDLDLIKRPALMHGNDVKADRYNGCIRVNGTPFFPFGVVLQTDVLEAVKEEGYNTVVRWGWAYQSADGSISPEEAARNDALLGGADRLGLKVVDRMLNTRRPVSVFYEFGSPQFQRVFQEWLARDIPRLLSVTKEHPALLAVMGFDEPGRDQVRWCNEALRAFKAADGHHPVFTNHNHGSALEVDLIADNDVISDYIYWHPVHARGRAIARHARHTADIASRVHKPFWVMPITEMRWSMGHVPLTVPEMLANAYLMLVNGASGLYYFAWPNAHRISVETHRALAEEIRVLSPALLRRAPEQEVRTTTLPQGHEPVIHAALRVRPDGTPVLLLVNHADHTVTLSLSLPWAQKEARLAPLIRRAGAGAAVRKFREVLEPLATRAYTIEGHSITDLHVPHVIEITEEHPKDAHMIRNLLSSGDMEQAAQWESEGSGIEWKRGEERTGFLEMSRRKVGDDPQVVLSPHITLAANHRYEVGAMMLAELAERAAELQTRSGAAILLRQRSGTRLELPSLGPEINRPGWHEATPAEFRTGDEPVEVQIEIMNRLNRGTVAFDDVFLRDLGPVDAVMETRNRIPNSSFEFTRLPGWPDRWQPESYDPWLSRKFLGDADAPFRLDHARPFDGKVCLRIEAGLDVVTAPFARWGDGVPATDGRPHVLSIHLRAARPGTKVAVSAEAVGSAEFNVGTDWKRYCINGIKADRWPQNFTGIRIKPDDTVWIDAAQLEEGETPTPYVRDGYRPLK